ncbi:unnamed protein product [Amoebophrya sp. A120]|nr:unnamed protein product [Amoebophrya sp. A120]|eukprot:GSA120T00018675001.1
MAARISACSRPMRVLGLVGVWTKTARGATEADQAGPLVRTRSAILPPWDDELRAYLEGREGTTYDRDALQTFLLQHMDIIQDDYKDYLAGKERTKKVWFGIKGSKQKKFRPAAIDVCKPDETAEMKLPPTSPIAPDFCKDVFVLGDVHGTFDDLLRLLAKLPTSGGYNFWMNFWEEGDTEPEGREEVDSERDNSTPQAQRGAIVFLGDYMDRAPVAGDSFYTMLFLTWLQAAYPDRVVLLRGNHETDVIEQHSYSVREEVDAKTKEKRQVVSGEMKKFIGDLTEKKLINEPQSESDVLESPESPVSKLKTFLYHAVFPLLPVAATVYGKALAVHAGVSNRVKPLEALRQINLLSGPKGDNAKKNKENCVVYSTSPEGKKALLSGADPRFFSSKEGYSPSCPNELEWADALERQGKTLAGKRRCGNAFDANVAIEFLQKEGLEVIIRGHEPSKMNEVGIQSSLDVEFRTEKLVGWKEQKIENEEKQPLVLFAYSCPFFTPVANMKNWGSFLKLKLPALNEVDDPKLQPKPIAWSYDLGARLQRGKMIWRTKLEPGGRGLRRVELISRGKSGYDLASGASAKKNNKESAYLEYMQDIYGDDLKRLREHAWEARAIVDTVFAKPSADPVKDEEAEGSEITSARAYVTDAERAYRQVSSLLDTMTAPGPEGLVHQVEELCVPNQYTSGFRKNQAKTNLLQMINPRAGAKGEEVVTEGTIFQLSELCGTTKSMDEQKEGQQLPDICVEKSEIWTKDDACERIIIALGKLVRDKLDNTFKKLVQEKEPAFGNTVNEAISGLTDQSERLKLLQSLEQMHFKRLSDYMETQLADSFGQIEGLRATVYLYGQGPEPRTDNKKGVAAPEPIEWVDTASAQGEVSASIEKRIGEAAEKHLLDAELLGFLQNPDKYPSASFPSQSVKKRLVRNIETIRKSYEEYLKKQPKETDIAVDLDHEIEFGTDGDGSRKVTRRTGVPKDKETTFHPMVVDICSGTAGIYKDSKTPSRLEATFCDDVFVYGDVHGAFDDLVRVLQSLSGAEAPKEGQTSYNFWEDAGQGRARGGKIVFNGDFMDRARVLGDSFYTILFLMWLQTMFPDRVVLLRGNHESARVARGRPRQEELKTFTNAVEAAGKDATSAGDFEKFLKSTMFPLLPFFATAYDKALVVHAGISEDVRPLEELRKVNLLRGPNNQNKRGVRLKREFPSVSGAVDTGSFATTWKNGEEPSRTKVGKPAQLSCCGQMLTKVQSGGATARLVKRRRQIFSKAMG